MTGVEEFAAVRNHLGAVAGELAGGAGQQRDVALPGHVEAVPTRADQGPIHGVEPVTTLRAREERTHIR